jgi:hypothetical protein
VEKVVKFLSSYRAAIVVAMLLPSASAWSQQTPPAGAADGTWKGRAEGGSCTPLDVSITVESGLLDGTATEPGDGTARVQGKRGEKLPAPPALWQLNGRVAANGAVDIVGLRSMKDRDRQRSRWSGSAAGGSMRIAETEGPCRRAATLSRGR